MQILDVSNPAAIGFELVDDGTRMQFVFMGDTVGFAMKSRDRDSWGPLSTVVKPERFGPSPAGYPVTKAARKQGRAWVEAFAAASSSD